MKKLIDIQMYRFYLWTAAGFFLLYSFAEFIAFPDTIFERSINSIFLVSYITVLNLILFEIVLPLFKLPLINYLVAFLAVVLLLFFYSFGLYEWRLFWIKAQIYKDYTPDLKYLKGVAVHARFSITAVLFFGVVRLIYNYNRLKSAAKQLRIEKQEAELNYLKSQTNPHFLFNTLNNIYTLSRRKSDLTPESILRLSTILRFMLYETSGKFIFVEQELEIIQDYIALEKLRYDDSLRINFNYEIEDSSQAIPPLLLIPLVENAFKHGVSETRGLPFIDIDLSIHHQQLSFVVKNSTEESSEQNAVKENIGLTNLRRQLELLYNDYHLSVKQEKSVFFAILKINLKSHV
jgi:sensor histidine kinase YesM